MFRVCYILDIGRASFSIMFFKWNKSKSQTIQRFEFKEKRYINIYYYLEIKAHYCVVEYLSLVHLS